MDVSDLQKKLTFPDPAVQCRAVSRLLDVVLKKKLKGIASIEQSAEISALWEACGCESQTGAAFAVESVISLVVNGCMHVDYAVNRLLAGVSSAKNLLAVLNGLGRLLVMQANAADDFDKTNYSVQYPKHPFITILETKPDSWIHILESLSGNFFSHGSSAFKQSFTSVVPLMDYVFLNSQGNMQITMFKNLLLQELHKAGRRQTSDILKYCYRVLPWLQVNDCFQCAENLYFLQHLKDMMIEFTGQKKEDSLILNLIFISLGLVSCCLDKGMDPSSALNIIEELSYQLSNGAASSSHICVNSCFAVISVVLLKTSGSVAEKLLKIGLLLLEKVPPCRIVAAMTFVPCVQLLSELRILSIVDNQNATNLLLQFIDRLQLCFTGKTACAVNGKDFGTFPIKYSEAYNGLCLDAVVCMKFALEYETYDDSMKMEWLLKIKQYYNQCSELVSELLFNLVAGLLFLPLTNNISKMCFDVLEVFCKRNMEMSVRLFSLLVYRQSIEKDPEILLLILEYLSKTASHKYAVAPVLSILQMMSKHQELKAQSIYLMYHLWKNQDRCFAYLEKMLVEKDQSVSFDSGVPEIRLAQISVIKKLCTEVPNKCSGPFLGTLSNIINESTSEAATPAAVLALDAVIELCKAEVIDLRSAWKALAPKLGRDKRPLVSSRVCDLLGLAPKLLVKSCAYDKFMNEAAVFLWRVVSTPSNDPVVLRSAYKALSGFSMECHNLKILPAAAKVNLKLPPSMISTPFEMGKSPEDVLTYIPGYCFIDLLKHFDDPIILEGYSSFLQSLVLQEVTSLPQSVYFKKKPVSRKQDSSDVLSSLPGILCAQYELHRSTVIQKNLAVGILLSYEPPMQFDKEGKPTKNCIAAHCRLYEQIFSMLLNEVNLDSNDWQRAILIPQAWKAFMEKAYFACEESCRMDMELQRAGGRLKGSAEEFKQLLETAWLWVRDRFIHLIKVTAKTTANATANSVFALAGLMNAVDKFYAGLDNNLKKVAAECGRHTAHQDFLLQCVDSILSVWDSGHRCSSKSLDLFQMQSQSSSASYLVKGCAGASLFMIATHLRLVSNTSIQHCFDVLFGNMSSTNSSALSLFSGLGFGLLMQQVVSKDSEIIAVNKTDVLLEAAQRLNYLCRDEDLKAGKLVALALCISSLSESGDPTYTPWIQQMCQAFHGRLMEENPSSMDYEYLAICTSSMMLSLASSGIESQSAIENLMIWFEDRQKEMLQCSSTAISLGLLSDGLQRLGSSKGAEVATELKNFWFAIVRSEKKPTLQRIAALNGLCSLFSAGRGLVQVHSEVVTANTQAGLKDLIQLMIQLLSATRDSSLQSLSCWELGRIHAVNTILQTESSAESSTYSYLSERSILKPLTKLVQGYITEETNKNHLLVALAALGQKFHRPLPPLNWVAFLTPLLQQLDDAELTEASLKIAVHQMASSSSALGVFSSYAAPPLLFKLPVECHRMLLKNLVTIASSLSLGKLSAFIQSFSAPSSKLRNDVISERLILEVLLESHEFFNSNQTVRKVLEESFKEIVSSLSNNIQAIRTHLEYLCKFVSQMSDGAQKSFFDHLINTDQLCIETFILCNMIKMGKKPLKSLKSCLETAKHEDDKTKLKVLSALLECISAGKHETDSEVSKTENVISLLMETIGWMNVLLDSAGDNQLESSEEVIKFLNHVCLVIIIGSSEYKVSYVMWPETKIQEEELIHTLPASLHNLAHHEIWNKHIDKIIDWLTRWKKNTHVQCDENLYYAFLSMCGLRSTEAYQKSKWTKIVSMLDCD